jgi:DNA invertase Pin-like site-specific DNA recombinase
MTYTNHNNTEIDMIYNYLGIGDQTSQMNLCIKYVVKNHLGSAELVIEESADRLLLKNLHSRLIATDSVLVSSLFQLGETMAEILDTIDGFVRKGVKVISAEEDIVFDTGTSVFLSAVVSEIHQGCSHSVTMESESIKQCGKRMLLHG